MSELYLYFGIRQSSVLKKEPGLNPHRLISSIRYIISVFVITKKRLN